MAKSAVESLKGLKNRQKVSLLYGDGDWHTHSIAKTTIRAVEMHDGPLGVRKPKDIKSDAGEMVPTSDPSTCFPAPCLTACSWDQTVLTAIGERVGLECRDQKTDVILAPGVNIKRNPLCGRNFEYLSEDPLLAGKMGAAYISGVQSKGVGACLKHFAANNQEFRRFNYSAEVDARALRELYLKPFEIAIKDADPWCVMCSYNKINGIYSSDNDWLLKNVLRKEWGYDGVVMSDWGATGDVIDSHNHGLDLEMPCHVDRSKLLANAIKKGTLKKEDAEASEQRIALLVDRVSAPVKEPEAFNYGMSHDVALEAAEKSIVLAKNDGDILPLKGFSDCCVIGALAKEFRYQGAGSSQVVPQHLVSLLDAINEGGDAKGIAYAPGYSLHPGEVTEKYKIDALDLASSHQKVILVLGLPKEAETEGFDRSNMRLPEEQYALFDSLYAVNKNLIVVLLCGAPVELPFADKASAIMIAYLPGEAGGKAIADLLLGNANPSGHLAESWPLHYTDVPSYEFYPGAGNVSLYKESIFVGYRYYLSAGKDVLFPFGHGLSYSKFVYSDLVVSRQKLNSGDKFSVSVKVANKSKVDGEEVVQLYIAPNGNKTLKPLRELKAFAKVAIPAGKEKKVTFSLSASCFEHYDAIGERFVIEGGTYGLEVGTSCADILLKGSIIVISSFEAIDRRTQLPSYYRLTRNGYFHVSNEEFTILLGHVPPHDSDRVKGRFDWNSTFADMSRTAIGKKICKTLKKMAWSADKSEEANEAYYKMLLDSSMRIAPMGGLSEKTVLAVLDLANHRLFKALWDVQFGKRK